MAEKLQAFENLKENENASLSAQEKDDLRKISTADIKSQKEKIGEKSFTVGGKSMKLEDIVKNLTFGEKGDKVEINIDGKKVMVGRQSELGAAIQVYAIANGKSIGKAGIDGMVGKDTIRGLKGSQGSEVDQQDERLFCVDELSKMDKDIVKLEKMNGVLTSENKQSIIKVVQKYSILIKEPGSGRFNYTYNQLIPRAYLKKFEKVGMQSSFHAKMIKMRDIAAKYEIDIHLIDS